MRIIKTETDPIGFTHQFHEQYYKGVKVAFASYIVHSKLLQKILPLIKAHQAIKT